jgi:protein required for attachment to host cells
MPSAGRSAADPLVHASRASRLLERLAMNKTCIVVADAGLARFYDLEEAESPSLEARLVERAVLTNEVDLKSRGERVTGKVRSETNTDRGSGPVHPMGARRERHRGELERRFGIEIIRQTRDITRGWERGVVVLVAEPQLLGLMREPLRKALHRDLDLKELARDYVHLTPSDLYDHLARNGIVPARRN